MLFFTPSSVRTRKMGCKASIPPVLFSRGTVYDLADVEQDRIEESGAKEDNSDVSSPKQPSSPEYQFSSSTSDNQSSPEKPQRRNRLLSIFFFLKTRSTLPRLHSRTSNKSLQLKVFIPDMLPLYVFFTSHPSCDRNCAPQQEGNRNPCINNE